MVASLADAGLSVIVDHVLLEPGWLPDLAARLEAHAVLFVGVICPLDTVVERERMRRDRTIGQAAAQVDVVHRAGGYDLEVTPRCWSRMPPRRRSRVPSKRGFLRARSRVSSRCATGRSPRLASPRP
jgi:chloramphenicol 3-O-phosphotransferase